MSVEKIKKCDCGNDLPQFPLLCGICDITGLCLQCSISDDLNICGKCKNEQTKSLESYDNVDTVVCYGCRKVKVKNPLNITNTQTNSNPKKPQCYYCTKYYCDKCLVDPIYHSCIKCFNGKCSNAWGKICSCSREKKYCISCYETHIKTNCPVKTTYPCKGNCGLRVMLFGNNRFKCPVTDCPRIYGCPECSKVLRYKQICCFEHISKKSCPGCHSFYPLKDNKQSIIILSRIKIDKVNFTRKYREYCKHCYYRLKTFIDSFIFTMINTKITIPNVIIEKIIVLLLARLY